jgi:hypothetical protein
MYAGYLLHFDRDKFRKKALSNLDVPGHIASLAVDTEDWAPRGFEACLISSDGVHVDHVALGRQGDMIVTGEHRIILHHLKGVSPVPLGDGDLKHFSKISSHACHRAPKDVWGRLVSGVGRADSDAWNSLMVRLEQMRQKRDEAGYDIMAMERDAIGVALEISAFDRSAELEGRERIAPGPASYITRLRDVARGKAIEDRLIEHDAIVFDALKMNRTDLIGTVVFEKQGTGERLYVTNANREKIESSLGVDLVYYNETYRSFVMVQYKRLRREGSDFVYRPNNDKSFDTELRKMLYHDERLRSAFSGNPLDFRLDPGVFYFKMCTDALYDPLSMTMIDGMYFPLRYWQATGESDAFRGVRGGRRVSYDKTGRCLSNELFAKLVRFGWVGSFSGHFEMLQECVASSLAGKRSVVVAQSTKRGEVADEPRRLRPGHASRGR